MPSKTSLVDTLISTVGANPYTGALAALPVLYALYRTINAKPARTKKVQKVGERVVVLGASSGIGRAIARQYAERGARVVVVGRRKALVDEVVTECVNARSRLGLRGGKDVLPFEGDFTSVEDMVKLREAVLGEWGGIDTLVVAAGVSALQPLLVVAGADVRGSELTPTHTTAEGIQQTRDVALKALHGNYVGPLVSAVTFIPLLSATSKAPAIVLISSAASVIPAPTRTIYASTKAASLVLYQALSIEQPQIAFTHIIPATVEGDFRASAVDSGPVRELDPNKYGLKKEDVARRCIVAADRGEKSVFLPKVFRALHLLYWIVPGWVERGASKKYNFKA